MSFSRSFHVGPGPFYRLEFDGYTGNAGIFILNDKLIKYISELFKNQFS